VIKVEPRDRLISKEQQLEIRLKIRDKDNREMINSYSSCEQKRRFDSVYRPLGKKRSSIKAIYGKSIGNSVFDPIVSLDHIRSMMFSSRVMMNQLMLGSSLGHTDPKDYCTLLNDCIEHSRGFESVIWYSEMFYSDLVDVVKKYTKENSLTIEESLGEQHNMDSVFKSIFPHRKMAEEYTKKIQIADTHRLQFLRSFKAMHDRYEEPVEGIDALLGIVPSMEDEELVQEAIWKYKMKEFNRIYAFGATKV
jgi:hypothetical protein